LKTGSERRAATLDLDPDRIEAEVVEFSKRAGEYVLHRAEQGALRQLFRLLRGEIDLQAAPVVVEQRGAQGLEGCFFEFGLEADVLRDEPRRHGQRNLSGFTLNCPICDSKADRDVVAALLDAGEDMPKAHSSRRRRCGQDIDERSGSAFQTACALVNALAVDALRRGVGIGQLQDVAVLELWQAREPEPRDETAYQRLRVRPEPGGPEIHLKARPRARDGEDPPAEPIARLEQRDRPALTAEAPRQCQAA
jgi:hypothetical protein